MVGAYSKAPHRKPLNGKGGHRTLPIFTREGVSWNKLNKVFDGRLETIIHEINEAIAA